MIRSEQIQKITIEFSLKITSSWREVISSILWKVLGYFVQMTVLVYIAK